MFCVTPYVLKNKFFRQKNSYKYYLTQDIITLVNKAPVADTLPRGELCYLNKHKPRMEITLGAGFGAILRNV